MKEAQKHSKEEVKKELENAKKELARAKEEMKHQKIDMKKELDHAKVGIDKAKAELKDYQEMIYDMEKDGLLNTKEDYSIEYKDGDLFINDKKQSQAVADKYKKYFKQKKIAIKKVDGEMKIDHLNISDTHFD
jgi:Asp-tRNA(Asn)/Glu-tRNA(Gln) amidotransferase A subunit family amidase